MTTVAARTRGDGSVALQPGDRVLARSGYGGGGIPGATYAYVGAAATLNLGTQNYATSPLWRLVTTRRARPPSALQPGRPGAAVSGSGVNGVVGETYQYVGTAGTKNADARELHRNELDARAAERRRRHGDRGGDDHRDRVRRERRRRCRDLRFGVSAVRAPTRSTSSSPRRTHYVDASTLTSAGDITIVASDTSIITAEVLALSAGVTIGLVSGAVSIGTAIAHNYIGFKSDGTAQANDVLAYMIGSSATAAGALTVHATESATIHATVAAASFAVSVGLIAIGAAGAGVSTTNKVGTSVTAYVDGNGTTGITITVGSADIAAVDSSTIVARRVPRRWPPRSARCSPSPSRSPSRWPRTP